MDLREGEDPGSVRLWTSQVQGTCEVLYNGTHRGTRGLLPALPYKTQGLLVKLRAYKTQGLLGPSKRDVRLVAPHMTQGPLLPYQTHVGTDIVLFPYKTQDFKSFPYKSHKLLLPYKTHTLLVPPLQGPKTATPQPDPGTATSLPHQTLGLLLYP